MQKRARARAAVRQSGFTLVELLVVVAMIGILAALGLATYDKFVSSAGTSEAIAMIQNIRAAEEAYKAETLVYLGCSGDLTSYYPQTTLAPNKSKWHWVQPNHPDYACWNMLNVATDGAVRFGYAVVTGPAGAAPPATSLAAAPAWPNPTTEPWYVVQAAGDRDDDGVYAIVVGASFAFGTGSGLATENDSE